ncbi:MAG: tetratricopeptide repeat protein [Alphaproteobacteria bacterium]|nr:tetratricopeptide repeat protein [Alphaproteobacteria bacterium]
MSNPRADPEPFKRAVQLLETGRHADCERLCRDLLKLNPAHADLNHILALSCRAQGNLQDAETAVTRALSQSQDNTSILNSFGLILLDQGKAEKAAKALTRALKINASMAAAHVNLGHAQRILNLLPQAEASYREALRLNPTLTDSLVQLALLLRNQGRLSELNFPLSPASGRFHDDPGVAMVQGLVALDESKPVDAEAAFRNALKKMPRLASLWTNLGLSLAKQGKAEEAQAAYEAALEINPSLPETHVNIADLWKYESSELARRHLIEAIKLKPDHANALGMLGWTWVMDEDYDAAITCFNQALEIDPDFQRAVFHRSSANFLTGELSAAWQDYNSRYGPSGITDSPVNDRLPLWDKSTPPEGPILVWTDQGIGDEILQLGYISDIYEQDISLIVVTSKRLVPIAARSFPNATVLSRHAVSDGGAITGQPIAQCPAMSIAALCWKSLDDHPDRAPYFIADKTGVSALRERYKVAAQDKPLIGISWRSTNIDTGVYKSLQLSDFLPVLEESGCTFVDLQYGETEQEISGLPDHVQQNIIRDPSVDPLKDMDAFASQVRALDMVITTSNTTAHTAGALGVPTLALIPCVGPGWCWYWFNQQTHSPWYPQIQILIQTKNEGWTPALTEARARLSHFIAEFQSLTGN